MTISWLQAVLLGLFACLSSMPGMGGSSIGNYTLGRPLIGGFVCGLILGDMQTGILVGCAMQVIYIALVTPGGTVSADVRAVSYIGIPLAMVALKSYGLTATSAEGAALATSFGAMVGTLGTVLFYGTATINLVWQHMGWKAVENRQYKKLYLVDMGLPWISHLICSFIPTMIMCKMGGRSRTDQNSTADGWSCNEDTVYRWFPASLRRYCDPLKTDRKESGRFCSVYSDLYWLHLLVSTWYPQRLLPECSQFLHTKLKC